MSPRTIRWRRVSGEGLGPAATKGRWGASGTRESPAICTEISEAELARSALASNLVWICASGTGLMTWEATAPRMSRGTLAAFASLSPTFAWCASTHLLVLVASYLLMLVLQPQALSMVWYMVETGPDSMGTWVVPVRSIAPSNCRRRFIL